MYLADRQDGMSLCTLLRLHLGTTDLSDALVIITPDVPFEELSVALARGLQRDTERCLANQRGIAVIVQPARGHRAAGPGRSRSMRPPRPKRRSRPFFLVLLLGAAGALFYYMRCGDGFGLGPGGGGGVGSESRDGERVDKADRTDETAPDTDDSTRKAAGTVRRCQLRLDAKGLTMNGDETSVDDAVSACKKAGGAELVATGDAVIGELQRVREALDRAGVEVFERSRSGLRKSPIRRPARRPAVGAPDPAGTVADVGGGSPSRYLPLNNS